MWVGTFTSGLDLSFSVQFLWKPLTDPPKSVSMVILIPVKVTMKINHQTHLVMPKINYILTKSRVSITEHDIVNIHRVTDEKKRERI